jgi:uncharacterized repeat protein (TIGR01451 family)
MMIVMALLMVVTMLSPALGATGLEEVEDPSVVSDAAPIEEPTVAEPAPVTAPAMEVPVEAEPAPEPAPAEPSVTEEEPSATTIRSASKSRAGAKSSFTRARVAVQAKPTDPPGGGNPGDVKVLDGSGAEFTGTDPHVPCLPFLLQFTNFTNDANATFHWTITTQSPTNPAGGVVASGTAPLDDDGNFTTRPIDLESILYSGYNAQPNQGYHVQVDIAESNKTKTFWVDCFAGKLTIAKEIAAGSLQTQTFDFHLNGANAVIDTLTDGENTGPLTVDSGPIRITEDLPAGWNAPVVSCIGGRPVPAGSTATTIIGAEDVTCTFTNSQTATPPPPEANLTIVKTGDATVASGDHVTYNVTVTNEGPDTATSVTVTDTLPPDTTLVSATVDPDANGLDADCSAAAGVLTCELGDMSVDQSFDIEIVVDTDDVTDPDNNNTETITNLASVSSPTDPTDDDDDAETDVTFTPLANLSIVKTDGPDPLLVGANLTYTLTVTNLGPDAAPYVVVTDTIPSTVTLSAVPDDCTYNSGTRVLTCSLGFMAAGGVETITFVVVPTVAGQVTNTAVVDCYSQPQQEASVERRIYGIQLCPEDPDEENNTSTVVTTVTPIPTPTPTPTETIIPPPPPQSADVSIVKTDAGDPVTLGDTLTYTLAIHNAGPDAAHNVTVVDTLPASTTFVSVSTAAVGASCLPNATATQVFCQLATLTAGQTVVVTVVVLPTATGTISNTATVSSTVPDPDPTDNTDTEPTEVVPPAPPADAALIVIEKQTLPDGSPATFAFDGDMTANLGDGEQVFLEVDPGTYTVTEAPDEGWNLTNIRCTDSDAAGSNSSGDVDSATATFNVEAGETATCVFTNLQEEVLPRPPIDREEPPGEEPDQRPRVRPGTLPLTGTDLWSLMLLALAFIIPGLGMVGVARRRRAKRTF